MGHINQNLSILFVEDNTEFRTAVVRVLAVYNEICEAETVKYAQKLLDSKQFDVILLDKRLPDGNGLDLIPQIKQTQPHAVIIVLTCDSHLNEVDRALSLGACDYIVKSEHTVSELLIRIPMAIGNASTKRNVEALEKRLKCSFKYEIVGRSKYTQELRETIQSLKGSLSPVLITGESGTGKELIARRLNATENKTRPFVAINCGAIPEHLVESELFGHVRGAFSGAVQNQIGKFELANGGDLFLDEIGELPLAAQTKLLRATQEGEITALGARRPVSVNVRIIAATNLQLEDLIQDKRFRKDLYFRLNVFRIQSASLRDRPEDIPDLVRSFLLQMAGPKWTISDEAVLYLSQQPWPGNIRELRNSIERAILGCRRRSSTSVERADVSLGHGSGLTFQLEKRAAKIPKSISEINEASYLTYLELSEKEFLSAALALCGHSVAVLASKLNQGRSTELGLGRKSQTESQ